MKVLSLSVLAALVLLASARSDPRKNMLLKMTMKDGYQYLRAKLKSWKADGRHSYISSSEWKQLKVEVKAKPFKDLTELLEFVNNLDTQLKIRQEEYETDAGSGFGSGFSETETADDDDDEELGSSWTPHWSGSGMPQKEVPDGVINLEELAKPDLEEMLQELEEPEQPEVEDQSVKEEEVREQKPEVLQHLEEQFQSLADKEEDLVKSEESIISEVSHDPIEHIEVNTTVEVEGLIAEIVPEQEEELKPAAAVEETTSTLVPTTELIQAGQNKAGQPEESIGEFNNLKNTDWEEANDQYLQYFGYSIPYGYVIGIPVTATLFIVLVVTILCVCRRQRSAGRYKRFNKDDGLIYNEEKQFCEA